MIGAAIERRDDRYVVGFMHRISHDAAGDWLLPHLQLYAPDASGEGVKTSLHRTALLVLAITLHNVPEGLAVGVAFGAVQSAWCTATLGAAIALAKASGCRTGRNGRPWPCRFAGKACRGRAAISPVNRPTAA